MENDTKPMPLIRGIFYHFHLFSKSSIALANFCFDYRNRLIDYFEINSELNLRKLSAWYISLENILLLGNT